MWEPWGYVEGAQRVHAPWPSFTSADRNEVVLFGQDRANRRRKAYVSVPDDESISGAEVLMTAALIDRAASIGESIDPDTIETSTTPDRVVTAEGSLVSHARIEVNGQGIEMIGADGQTVYRTEVSKIRALVCPPSTPPVRLTRRGRIAKRMALAWLALALIASAVVGIVLLVQWNTRHANRQTDSAIAACEHGGGTYLYGDRQLARLTWSLPALDRPQAQHVDYLVTTVPHTGGGLCLTPEDKAVG